MTGYRLACWIAHVSSSSKLEEGKAIQLGEEAGNRLLFWTQQGDIRYTFVNGIQQPRTFVTESVEDMNCHNLICVAGKENPVFLLLTWWSDLEKSVKGLLPSDQSQTKN